MRVLLVDDSDAIERYVRAAVEPDGWDVDRAADGAGGLAKAARAAPDVILLDFVLPDVDGIELLEKLFAAGIRAPTIVLSGAQTAEVMRRFADAGAVDYLAKSDMTAARLRTALRMAFDMRVIDAPPGRGARVPSVLPEESEASPAPHGVPGTALVIDDTASFRALVRAMLAPAGWRVLEAEDGETGLALADREKLDVILLDHVLPDTDGLELLHMLRSGRDCPPVVALTGHGDEELAEVLLRVGAADYLSKDGLTAARLLFAMERAMWLGRASVDVTWRKARH